MKKEERDDIRNGLKQLIDDAELDLMLTMVSRLRHIYGDRWKDKWSKLSHSDRYVVIDTISKLNDLREFKQNL